ncbi:isochorismatase family protein [Candidatus Pantoea persica]|uniref:isochorismatase family protein n=1 Tax=Candidatus Pantoea persica TaxID=2518128 RepID=UPI00215D91BB|nr:isochorismatase family protein [Candidatus Pantoea persica]MBA2814109.1 Streptothricin hydrolase [Candidatus Pantoea persica]
MNQRVVIVVDMQNGVFATPRFDRAGRTARINQLAAAADRTIFITHLEGEMQPGSQAFELLPELRPPAGSLYVTKTARDSFWRTTLAATLAQLAMNEFVICGCATDYCIDTTIKVGAVLGYRITVAGDEHTTANRTYASAEQLIGQHNEAWAGLSLPGNVPRVVNTANIVADWLARRPAPPLDQTLRHG